jgi:hypothetical protein
MERAMRGRRVRNRGRLRRRLIVAASAAVALCAAGGGIAWAGWQDDADVSYKVEYAAPTVGYGVREYVGTSTSAQNAPTDCRGGDLYRVGGEPSGLPYGCYLTKKLETVDLEINKVGDGYIPFETQAYSQNGDEVDGTLKLADIDKAGSLLAGSAWSLYSVPAAFDDCNAGYFASNPSQVVASSSGSRADVGSVMPAVPASSAPEWKTFGWCLVVTGWAYQNPVTVTADTLPNGLSVNWWTTVEQGPSTNTGKSVIHVTADTTPYSGS